MEKLDLKIGEMNCVKCAERLQSLLGRTSGVKQATVSYETGSGAISYRPQITGADQLIAVVEAAGFTAERA